MRTLDHAHAARVGEIHAEFAARWQPAERTAVAAERAQVARLVDRCEALAIAGGHVLVLANRLRLFDVLPPLGRAAGARVVGRCDGVRRGGRVVRTTIRRMAAATRNGSTRASVWSRR